MQQAIKATITQAYEDFTHTCLLNADCVDQMIYLAQVPVKVVSVTYTHATAGNDASAVNVQLTKDSNTDAPGGGTNLLTNNSDAGFNCKGTANTVQTGLLVATEAARTLAAGDRLSLDFAGTVTTLAGVAVSVRLQYV